MKYKPISTLPTKTDEKKKANISKAAYAAAAPISKREIRQIRPKFQQRKFKKKAKKDKILPKINSNLNSKII